MVIELKKGYSIDSWYDKFTDSYITRLLDPEGNQVRDALYSGDIVGRNYDIQSIRDFFKTYMKDSNFNLKLTKDLEDEDSTQEKSVDEEQLEESLSLTESLDVDTAYVIRNDGEVFKCDSFHPYMKDSNMTVDQFFYESAFDVTLNMFYKISKQVKVIDGIKALVNSFVKYNKSVKNDVDSNINFDYLDGKILDKSRLQKLYDTLNDLTNQEFCRVRTSSMYGSASSSSHDIYIRISSDGFDWSDIIYKFIVENSKFIGSITIDKDNKSVDKPIVYVHKGQKIDHMPIEEFLSLPGNLVLESVNEDELKRKAIKTKIATRKSKLPMTRIMPDYGAGIDHFNAATADGNSGMASTTGSTGLGEAWMTRPELIGKLKGLGFNYKFDKYSDKALYRIYQERLRKIEKQKAEKRAEQQKADLQDQKRENAKDSYFKDDIEFESEDAAREYFGESMENNYESIEDVIKRFLLSNGIKVSNIEQSYNEDEDCDIVKVWTDTMDQEKATSLVSDILYENGAKIYDEYSDLDEVKDEYVSIVLCDLDYMKNKMETMKMNDKFYLNDMHEAWDIQDEEPKQELNESVEKKEHGFNTLTEGFKYFERKYFNENYADAELQIMYESMRDKLSSEDIKKLGAFMNRAEEPDEVITYMKGLLSEDLTEEFEEDDIDRSALNMISYPLNNAIMRAANNAGCWVEENGINVYPSDNAVELVYWVEGDWKHDHIRFNNIVSNVVEEMGYELIGSSEEDADSEEPDGYGANHIYQIKVDSARTLKNESLNEAWFEQAWADMTPEDEENLRSYGISWEAVGREGQETIYRFSGTPDAIDKAEQGGYFYDPDGGLYIHHEGDAGVRDIDSAVKELLDRMSDVGFVVDENSSGITDNWSGGKHIQIINPDLYFPTSETEGEEISEEEAYRLFKDDVKDIVGIIDMFEDEVRDMFYITFNFGANEAGQITAGLDIRPMKR